MKHLSSNYGVIIFPLSIGCNVGFNIGSFCFMGFAFGQILMIFMWVSFTFRGSDVVSVKSAHVLDLIKRELDEVSNSIISGLTCSTCCVLLVTFLF